MSDARQPEEPPAPPPRSPGRGYDLFLSHNSADKPVVERVARHLLARGLAPWLDAWVLTAGGDWQAELAAGLRLCRACAVFVGPHDVGAWSAMEARLALDRAAKDPAFRVFAVLLPGLPEPFDPAALPPFLAAYSWVDLRGGLDDEAGMESLVRAVQGEARGVPMIETGMATSAVTGNLPAALSSFVGREREQVEVLALLAEHRLVTLVGTGGAGKTRLALRVAEEAAPDYPEGAWLAELAPLADPALVPGSVARALGLREEPGEVVMGTLARHLKARRLLLVLDNCEHLIAACARLAEVLLRACPGLRVLATSREGLGVPGEQVYRVPSLATPDPERPPAIDALAALDAVRLFVARACERQPDFALTAENARAVAAVCVRLAGIPLAIELAAVRVGSLPVEAIAARLGDRFRLLTGGPRTALPRQRTLRASIDWSWELLSDQERILLRRLSVFAGGCTLEAAEAVCDAAGDLGVDLLDSVAALMDKSLLLQQAPVAAPPRNPAHSSPPVREPRFTMLETIREYALECLETSGEAERLRNQHARVFLQLAEEAGPQVRGAATPAWLGRLENEHDNLRAVLAWSLGGGAVENGLRLAVALCDFWLRLGYLSEGRTWIERALAALEELAYTRTVPGDDATAAPKASRLEMAARLQETYGDILLLTGHHVPARTAFQLTLDRVPSTERIRPARLRRKIGNAWKVQSHYDEALGVYEMAESVLGQDPAPSPEWWQEWAQIRLERIDVHYWLNNWEAMAALANETETIVERHGTPAQRSRFLAALLMMHVRHERYGPSDQAVAVGRAALALSEAGSHGDRAFHRFLLSFALLWHGDLDEAEELMLSALAEAERTEDISLQARCLTYLAVVRRKRGQVDDARHYSVRGLTVAEVAGMPEYVGTARANLAWVAWRAGNLAEAEADGRAALAAWQQLPVGHASCCFQWTALWPLIAVALARDRVEDAIEPARALLAPWQQRLPDALTACVSEAIAAWDRRQEDSADGCLRDALGVAQQAGYL